MSRVIQEAFGQATIDAVVKFIRSDIKTVQEYTADDFAHVADIQLRERIARAFFSARWIYKVGFSLLVDGDELYPHLQGQVVAYGTVCEGLLSDAIFARLSAGPTGQKYHYALWNPDRNSINWNVNDRLAQLRKRTFFWLVEVAIEEGIVDQALGTKVHEIRLSRNGVHPHVSQTLFRHRSKTYFETTCELRQTLADWRRQNP